MWTSVSISVQQFQCNNTHLQADVEYHFSGITPARAGNGSLRVTHDPWVTGAVTPY